MGRIGALRLLVLVAIAIGLTACTRAVGTYPPASPLAGEMSSEWQDFAYRVDAACATNFNAGQAELAQLEERDDLSDAAWESAYRFIQAKHQQRTHDEIAALGQPPAKPGLFRRWLANVGLRAEIMREIARAWRDGNDRLVTVHSRRIEAAKIEADWMALHFGLRICPSNGPMQTRDPDVDYLDELNEVCVERMRRDHRLWRRGRFTPNVAVSHSLGETLDLAAVAPPVEQFGLRRRVLRVKKALDRFHVRAIRRAARSPDPDAWVKVRDGVGARILRERDRLARLGLIDCAWPRNWR